MFLKKGFTLVELLVTISIVGILSSMSMAQFKHVKFKAERTKELSELRQKMTQVQLQRVEIQNGSGTVEDMMEIEMELVGDAINLARKSTDKTLRGITTHNCSECICRGDEFGTVADTTPGTSQFRCIAAWENVYTKISEAAGLDLSFLRTDPWGSPYFMDENENEWAVNPCREDTLISAGANRTRGSGEFRITIPNYRDYSESAALACGS